jgi:hypothetical protein
MLANIILLERTDLWASMRRSFAPFGGLELSVHVRSLAGSITITFELRFSVHTPIADNQRAFPTAT